MTLMATRFLNSRVPSCSGSYTIAMPPSKILRTISYRNSFWILNRATRRCWLNRVRCQAPVGGGVSGGAQLDTATYRESLVRRNAGFIQQRDEPHGPLPDKSGVPVVVSRCTRERVSG